MSRLLFEIGLEELPAHVINQSLSQMESLAAELLNDYRIRYEKIESCGAPRRLTLMISGLAEQQTAATEEIKGPPQDIALKDGKLTQAALGFLRKNNASETDIHWQEFQEKNYLYLFREIESLPSKKLLPEILTAILQRLRFPKLMRWGSSSQLFVRPIHWLVALLDEKAIPLSFAGIESGRTTRGHRFLGKGNLSINSPADYLAILEADYVFADGRKRRKIILDKIREFEDKHNFQVVIDSDLLEEIVNLVDYPVPFVGSFPQEYLELPEEVIITPMQEHQRYFPVRDRNGKLLARFVGVSNNPNLERIISGNEKVLVARLADARFFYHEDMKYELEQYNEKLKKVIFQEDIGTVYQKLERVRDLALEIGQLWQINSAEMDILQKAATLSKADLATQIVSEFPELQGIMGRNYALAQGLPREVAMAIEEHYRPIAADGQLPETPSGKILALADKLDTLTSAFAVKLTASGSQDPYGLRRQAMGIVRILLDTKLPLDLKSLVEKNYDRLQKSFITKEELWRQTREFLELRLRNALSEYRYDILDAAVSAEEIDVYEIAKMATALDHIRKSESYAGLIAGYKRANNLAEKNPTDQMPNAKLFTEEAESKLYQSWLEIESAFTKAVKEQNYIHALELFSGLEQPINTFFDKVMVMVEDDAVRQNRLALLGFIVSRIRPLVDLSKLTE